MNTRDFPFQIKELSQSGEIVGLAAAFGNVDHGGDVIMPGAFAASLARHAANGTRPAMLFAHDMARPVGRWDELREVDDGLLVTGRMTLDARDGAEAYALARDGALTGLSIGYRPEKARDAGVTRQLHAVDLLEVSLVSVPMNEHARIRSVKAITGARDIEDLLREAGLSSRRAKVAAGAAWRAISSTDDDDDEAAAAAMKAAIARLTKGN